ncbi:MAG: sigma-54 dependent transcriptional regulator [Desulfobacterales bacterium]|nr:sigma-54 dependent transcriptional regulator [Desulfobacterales bacterium]
MNQTMIDHIGRDASGGFCYTLLHGLEQPCPWCVRDQVMSGHPAHFEYKSPRDNRWYYYVSTPIRDAAGMVVAQQLIAVDIDERKQREEAQHLEQQALQQENRLLKSPDLNRYGLRDIVGKSPAMQAVYSLILDVASSDASVLIYGESGTGKELVASALHNLSPRKAGPFLPVNCGGIPDTLVESEFFGFKKGAFTGAHIDKSGFLKTAHKGSLFLDEIGDINLNMQVKLLRALDGDGYTPLGGKTPVQPDVRIICATNKDLGNLVAAGTMRSDFFYRINVVPIHLPPLRERREDIPLLIYHFLGQYSTGSPLPYIPPEIMSALEAYDWPGNVRELQNIIHRYVALNRLDVFDRFFDGTPDGSDAHHHSENVLSPELSDGAKLPDDICGSKGLSSHLQAYEKQLLVRYLRQNQWNQSRVAALLGINRKTLYSKIKKLNIEKV